LETAFKIGLFFIGPIGLTVVAVALEIPQHSSWLVEAALVVALSGAFSIGYLFGK